MLSRDLERYIDGRRSLGFKLRSQSVQLRNFVAFAEEHGDRYIKSARVLAWASQAPSPEHRRNRLLMARRFALAMKARKEHRVPLSTHAFKIISSLPCIAGTSYVFPGHRDGRPLSGMAMEMLLRRMGRSDITVHGFRSTFRDWAAEATDFPREISELCLAHEVGSEVERAYRRSDLLLKRRGLMQKWADYCCQI